MNPRLREAVTSHGMSDAPAEPEMTALVGDATVYGDGTGVRLPDHDPDNPGPHEFNPDEVTVEDEDDNPESHAGHPYEDD